MAEYEDINAEMNEPAQYYDTTWVNDGPLFEKLIEKLLNYHPGTFGVYEYPRDSAIVKNLLTDFEVTLDSDGKPNDPSKVGNFVIHNFTGGPDEISGYSPVLLVSTIFGKLTEKENADPDDPNKTYMKYTQTFFLYVDQFVYYREAGSTEWENVSFGPDTSSTITFYKEEVEPTDNKEKTVWLDTSGDTPVWKVYVEQSDGTFEWKEIGIPGSMDSTVYDPTNKKVPIFGYINDEIEKVSGGYGRFLKHIANELQLRHITAEQRARWNQIPTAEELSTAVENAENSIKESNADLYENELGTNQRAQELHDARETYIAHINPDGTETTDPHVTFQKAQSWDRKADGDHSHDLDNHVTIHAENIIFENGKKIPARYLPDSIKERVYEINSLEDLSSESITDELRATKYHTGNILVIEDPSADYKKRRWFKIINPALIGTESYSDGILEFTKDFTPSNDLYWAYIANKSNTAVGFKLSDEAYTKASYAAKYGEMENLLIGIANNIDTLSQYRKVYFPNIISYESGTQIHPVFGFVHTTPDNGEYPLDFEHDDTILNIRDLRNNVPDAFIELIYFEPSSHKQIGVMSPFSIYGPSGSPNIYWTKDKNLKCGVSNYGYPQYYNYDIDALVSSLWKYDSNFDLSSILNGSQKIDIESIRYLPESSTTGTTISLAGVSQSYDDYIYAGTMNTLMNVYNSITQTCNVFIVKNSDDEFISCNSVNALLGKDISITTYLLGTCRCLYSPCDSPGTDDQRAHFAGQLIGVVPSIDTAECYFFTSFDPDSPDRCRIIMDKYYTHVAAYALTNNSDIHTDEFKGFIVAFATIEDNNLYVSERYFNSYNDSELTRYFSIDSELDAVYARSITIQLPEECTINSMVYLYPHQDLLGEEELQRLRIVLNNENGNKILEISDTDGTNPEEEFSYQFIDTGDLNSHCSTIRQKYGASLATDSDNNIHLINRNGSKVKIFSPPKCLPEEISFLSIKPLRIPIFDWSSSVENKYLENMYRVIYKGNQSNMKYTFVFYESKLGAWESFSGTGIENIVAFDYASSSAGLQVTHILDKISNFKYFYTYKPSADRLGGCMSGFGYGMYEVYTTMKSDETGETEIDEVEETEIIEADATETGGEDVIETGGTTETENNEEEAVEEIQYTEIADFPVDFVLMDLPFYVLDDSGGGSIITLEELQSSTWDELRRKYPKWRDFIFNPMTTSYPTWSYLEYKKLTWNDLSNKQYSWTELEDINPSTGYVVDYDKQWTLYSRKLNISGEYIEIIIGCDENGRFAYYSDLDNLTSCIETVKKWEDDDLASKIVEINDALKALTSDGFELFDMYSALPLTWIILNKLNYTWSDFQNHYTSWHQIMNGISS